MMQHISTMFSFILEPVKFLVKIGKNYVPSTFMCRVCLS